MVEAAPTSKAEFGFGDVYPSKIEQVFGLATGAIKLTITQRFFGAITKHVLKGEADV